MRSSDEEESEATRIYGIQTNREFQREFFGVKNSSIKDIEYERKSKLCLCFLISIDNVAIDNRKIDKQ